MQSFTEPMCYVTIVFDPQLAEFDDAFTETAFFGGLLRFVLAWLCRRFSAVSDSLNRIGLTTEL